MLIPLLSLFTAQAGFSVEGPSFGARSGASDFAKSAKAQGHKGRIVRRYKDGSGWEFVVRFEDLEESKAREVASQISLSSSSPMFLFDDDGKQIEVVTSKEKPEPVPPAPVVDEPDWIEAVIEKHGPGRTVFAEADRVKVVFQRSLPDGRVVKHIYARRGTDLYLSIEGVAGDVTASETVALGEKAWLVVDDDAKEQDLQRARETIARFGPTSLVPLVLDLERMGKDHPELHDLSRKGTAKVGDDTCTVYASSGSALLAVAEDGLVRRVTIDGEKRVMEFGNYQGINEVQVPRKVRILTNGSPESVVEITLIELDGDLDDAWFAPRG